MLKHLVENTEYSVHMAELVAKDSMVSVAAMNHSHYEYYLHQGHKQ